MNLLRKGSMKVNPKMQTVLARELKKMCLFVINLKIVICVGVGTKLAQVKTSTSTDGVTILKIEQAAIKYTPAKK